MRVVLFYRDFRGFRGAHLKVWHYFNHVRHCPGHVPRICFSKDSIWDESNPWLGERDQVLESFASIRPDIYFLSGRDWTMMDSSQRDNSPTPIINLIQSVRHARRDDPRYAFLRHKAIRICVGEEIRAAIAETHQVNGPLYVIPNGIEVATAAAPTENTAKDCDLLIAAIKQPELGRQLQQRLEATNRRVELLTTSLTRPDYLGRVSRARVTVFLPKPAEGLYLPALEGMMLGTLVVCPDVVGVAYCRQGFNSFRPDYTVDKILNAITAAWQLSPSQAGQMLDNARQTLDQYSLRKERTTFLEILQNVSQLW